MIGGEENDALFDRTALRQRIAELEATAVQQASDFLREIDMVRELKAENERLRHLSDDTKRLEFVIKNYMRVYSLDMSGKRTWSGVGRPIGNGTTPREAIDAAMEVEGEK